MDFDSTRLDGKRVVSINGAAARLKRPPVPSSLILFSADPKWILDNRETIAAHAGEKYATLALDTWPECTRIDGLKVLERAHFDGLSTMPDFLCVGGNSGYAAINLAVLKGSQDIHLVGYDMASDEDKFAQWRPRFRTMIPQLIAAGVTVTNHNLKSLIDAFPRRV